MKPINENENGPPQLWILNVNNEKKKSPKTLTKNKNGTYRL